jgi:hypothetical protein
MKTKLLALIFLAGASAFAETHFSIGIDVGPRYGYYAPPPPPRVAYVTPAPGPGFVWVSGYWYPSGSRYAWRDGYWARRPYGGAYWVAPRYHERRYYPGYWRR